MDENFLVFLASRSYAYINNLAKRCCLPLKNTHGGANNAALINAYILALCAAQNYKIHVYE